MYIDPAKFLYYSTIAVVIGGLFFLTAMGLLVYWLSSDSKDEPIEKGIKDIKSEIRSIRRELQKLSPAIADILKHSSESVNAAVGTKAENTKAAKPRARNK
jgi:hypothetical protein